jgi:hypothetical protein
MATYKIEIGIERPKRKNSKYPFWKMEKGESVIMAEIYTRELHQKIFSAARNYGLNHGKEFSAKKTEDNKLRVWRIK